MSRTIRRGLAPFLFLLSLSGVALGEAQMLTAAGMTGTTIGESTCPSNPTNTCSSGWFRVNGAAKVYVQVESASTSSATVRIEGKSGPTGSTQLIKSISNPALGDVAWSIEGMGWVRISVTVHASGTLKANINAYTFSGTLLW